MAEHYPVKVVVESGDLGTKRVTAVNVQMRCGCTTDLRYDYGHHNPDAKQATVNPHRKATP